MGADAQQLAAYSHYLEDAGFSIGHVDPRDADLREMFGQIRTRLVGLESMTKIGKIEAPAVDAAEWASMFWAGTGARDRCYTAGVNDQIRIHPTAEVSPAAQIGPGTSIWNGAQVREGAQLGKECNLGKNVYIDFDVRIGDRCKIQNNASIFHGTILEDGVFVGPHACITNDKLPRAITPQGELKGSDDWEVGPVLLRYGASIGAAAVVLPGVTVGRFALVGAAAVVTRSVPDHALVVGSPARVVGFVCACGGTLDFGGMSLDEILAPLVQGEQSESQHGHCARCGLTTVLGGALFEGAAANAL